MADTSNDTEKAARAAEAIDEIGVDRLSSLLTEVYEDHILDEATDAGPKSDE